MQEDRPTRSGTAISGEIDGLIGISSARHKPRARTQVEILRDDMEDSSTSSATGTRSVESLSLIGVITEDAFVAVRSADIGAAAAAAAAHTANKGELGRLPKQRQALVGEVDRVAALAGELAGEAAVTRQELDIAILTGLAISAAAAAAAGLEAVEAAGSPYEAAAAGGAINVRNSRPENQGETIEGRDQVRKDRGLSSGYLGISRAAIVGIAICMGDHSARAAGSAASSGHSAKTEQGSLSSLDKAERAADAAGCIDRPGDLGIVFYRDGQRVGTCRPQDNILVDNERREIQEAGVEIRLPGFLDDISNGGAQDARRRIESPDRDGTTRGFVQEDLSSIRIETLDKPKVNHSISAAAEGWFFRSLDKAAVLEYGGICGWLDGARINEYCRVRGMRRSRALDRPGKTREGTCRLSTVTNDLLLNLDESRSRERLGRLHADRLVTVIGPAQGRGKTSSGLQGHAERSSSSSALETNEPIASSP